MFSSTENRLPFLILVLSLFQVSFLTWIQLFFPLWQTCWLITARKSKQVKQNLLKMAQFHYVSQWAMPASQHPRIISPNWNVAIINVINYTCAFPALTSQIVCCGKKKGLGLCVLAHCYTWIEQEPSLTLLVTPVLFSTVTRQTVCCEKKKKESIVVVMSGSHSQCGPAYIKGI